MLGLAFGSSFPWQVVWVAMACLFGGCQDFAKDVGRAMLGRRLASPGPLGRGASAHIIQRLECPGEVRPHAELLFFLKKEPLTLTKAVVFEPFVPAETLKACALIGLHLTAGGSASGSSGGQSPDLGHMWRYGCPESPEWDDDCESCSESEDLSSSDFREHNVEGLALHVIGINWAGEKVSLFLEDRELARALSWHVAWIWCARKCTRLGNWVATARRAHCHSKRKPFSHSGRAFDREERDVV